jgi:hypothetical protein
MSFEGGYFIVLLLLVAPFKGFPIMKDWPLTSINIANLSKSYSWKITHTCTHFWRNSNMGSTKEILCIMLPMIKIQQFF